MNFHFSDFIEGVNDALEKVGYDQTFQVNGEIFPNISSQTKWHFARTPTHVHLHDGANVFSFHMPEGCKEDEDYPLVKTTGTSLHDYDKDATVKGIAQVHRADPGCIYFTLQDGHTNPTLRFKHIEGENWRAMPKAKKCCKSDGVVHQAEFLQGVSDKCAEGGLAKPIIDTLCNGINTGGAAAIRGLGHVADHPLMAAGAGLAAGGLYDLGKRHLYNTPEENAQETPGQRVSRYVMPAAAAGLGGLVLNTGFDRYNSQKPVWPKA